MIITLLLDISLTQIYQLSKNISFKQGKPKIYIKHPVYHHTFQKNTTEKVFYTTIPSVIFTNSLGFKDKSIRNVPLSSKHKRLLFIGDSFTEGVALAYEDTFVGRIDTVVNSKGIEVLNAGRSGYSPIIYWRKVKHLLEDVGLEFDELVVFIDICDISDVILYYELTSDMRVVSKNKNSNIVKKFEKVKSKLDKIYLAKRSKKFYLENIISKNTTVMHAALKSLTMLLYSNYPSTQKTNEWYWFISPFFLNDKWTLDANVYTLFAKEGVALAKMYMTKLLKLLSDRKIKLSVAVYPWPSQVWHEDIHSKQVNIWKEWSKKNNVTFINYFPDFVVTKVNKEEKLKILRKYYIPGDVHFNKNGNKVIADKFLKEYFKGK